MQERLSGSGELPIRATLRKGPHPLQCGQGSWGGKGFCLCGTDSVLPSVRSLPRSQGEARGAVAWPCLPEAFQDFPAPCQLGGPWGSPHPGHSGFLVPSGGSAEGQSDISISVSSSPSLLSAPRMCLPARSLWGALAPIRFSGQCPGSHVTALGILLTVHTPPLCLLLPENLLM